MNKDMLFKMFKNQKYIEQLKQIPQKFNVKHDEENNVTEITIYGVIGDSWWEESFSANDIDKALNEAGNNDVIINLNSPGGDAFDGISIFNRLKRHKGKVTVHVDGWACSAASIVAMAGDEVVMELGSMMMIHEASTIAWGTKKDMLNVADMLEQLEDGAIDIYSTKALISRDEIRKKIDAETWMSAKTAVEWGFADEAVGVEFDGELEEEINVDNIAPINQENILNELQEVLQQNKPEEIEPKQPVAAKRKGFFF